MRRTVALVCFLALACATPQLPPPAKLSVPRKAAARPSAATAATLLRDLSDRYWTLLLETGPLPLLGDPNLGGPLYATSIGNHGFDGKLDDLSREALVKLVQALAQLRTEVDAIPAAELGGEDALTLEILRGQLEAAQESRACEGELWVVDQLDGPHVALAQTSLYFPLGTAKGAADLAARYGQAGRFFAQLMDDLQRGIIQGKTSPRANVERVIASLERLLEKDAAHSDLLPPEERFAGLPRQQRGPAREAIRRVIDQQVLPAVHRYREFLGKQLLPKARTDIGVWVMNGGEACYAFLIRYHTGTQLSPQELHELGMRELARIEAEQEEIVRAQGAAAGKDGRVDLKAFRASLERRRDQFKRSADELLAWNRATLARAMAALPRAFRRMPQRPIETRPIEEYRAPSSTAAFYQPAPDDGTQPAIYYVNTYKPETRALYNEEALCFHETVPGHHLQGSIAQELAGLPDFRRQTGETAYVEGWALYAERMSDETLRLYSGPLARYGMLGYQAWRAARLVVDTGMHALKWDRDRAIQFLVDHTTLPAEEAANEIDRYAIRPGQSLAYMVGELELYRLRRLARERLGEKFDLKEFHDVVLSHGAVPLRTLSRLVMEWLDRKAPAVSGVK